MSAVFNPKLDLSFERTADLSPEQLWAAWTQPDLLMQWFCPKPWQTTACAIDLRAGGAFSFTMQSPEGQTTPNEACYLEVIPNQKLVWTSVFTAGFRPQARNPDNPCDFAFTAVIELTAIASGTHYRATVMHSNEKDRETHANMGFEAGWGAAFAQLVTLMQARR